MGQNDPTLERQVIILDAMERYIAKCGLQSTAMHIILLWRKT
jgi:hypothetical protein